MTAQGEVDLQEIDAVLFLQRHKQIRELADILRGAKKEKAIRTQCMVEDRDDLALHVAAEIRRTA